MPFKAHLPAAILLLLIFSCCLNANGQSEGEGYVFHANQVLRVAALPSLVADSTSESAVLTASVATVVMEGDVCCGRNSALEDQVAMKVSLRELGERLRGKHYLDNGSPILVVDHYWSGASVNAEDIIGSLIAQRPLLMDWNGHLYVLYGAIFDDYKYYSGADEHVIHTLLLVDTRFSDDRRYVTFNRQTDDWAKVSGLLALTITR